MHMTTDNNLTHNPNVLTLYKLACWSSIILLVYSLATLLGVFLIGPPPATIEECFEMLNENILAGVLRLDVLTVFAMPLYYILFLGLYLELKDRNFGLAIISISFVFVGVTLFLAAPSVFSFVSLSDKYFAANSEVEKNILVAAGEALLATDIWHGTGPRLGGLLVQTGAVVFSILMLKGTAFSKLTAIVGIVTHGLDLIHVVLGFFNTPFSDTLMMIAGPLYLLWFPLISQALFRLGKE